MATATPGSSRPASEPFTFGLTREQNRERLIYGVRRMVEDCRARQHGNLFISVEETEAMLSLIPDVSKWPQAVLKRCQCPMENGFDRQPGDTCPQCSGLQSAE